MTTPNTNGEAKRTQGHWSKGRDDMTDLHHEHGYKKNIYAEDDRGGVHPVFGDPLPFVVGEAYGETPEEAHSNARFFAAAPQMFEALEDAMEFIEREYADRMTWPDIYRQIDKVLDLARGEKGAEG